MFQILLFLGSDCLIAYKSTFLYIIGSYMLMLLKFFMAEPRPFWETNDIQSTHCNLMFSSPDRHAFNMMFFWVYITYQYLWKYNANPSKVLVGGIYGVIVTLMILSSFVRAYYGLIYMH